MQGKKNSTDIANQDHLPRARKRSLPLLPPVSVSTSRSTKSFFGANSSSHPPPMQTSPSHSESTPRENCHPMLSGSTSTSSDPNDVLQELRKTKSAAIVTLVSRVEKTKEWMEKFEKNVCSPVSSSSSSSDHKARSSRKKDVPLQVRVSE